MKHLNLFVEWHDASIVVSDVSPERTKRMSHAASTVLIVPKAADRVSRKRHAASTVSSDVSTERMS